MKCRNLFSLVALATMMLSSCSSDEVVNNYSPENAIQFGTYVGRDAEARVATITTQTLQNFGVFAYYHEKNATVNFSNPNFMNNQKVEKITYDKNTHNSAWQSGWKYDPIKYWPNNLEEQITFLAYSPWSSNNTNSSFEIKDNVDYVAAPAITSSKGGVDDVNDCITFKFQHMMSKIGFKVEAIIDQLEHDADENGTAEDEEKNGNDQTDNSIDKATVVVVTGVKLEGKLATSGTYKVADDGWVLDTGTASSSDVIYALDTKDFVDVTSNCFSETLNDDGAKVYEYLDGQKAEKITKLLSKDDSSFMIVPQNDVEVKITVNYSVITRDENLQGMYSKVDNVVTSDEFTFDFNANTAYNFVLHLGLTSVKLSAQVNVWEDPSDIIVNVPLNIPDNDQTTTTNP